LPGSPPLDDWNPFVGIERQQVGIARYEYVCAAVHGDIEELVVVWIAAGLYRTSNTHELNVRVNKGHKFTA